MAGIHVKICGLSRPEDVLAARDADDGSSRLRAGPSIVLSRAATEGA